jgi:regulator of protease activity HflC (stomatin/prohibitin superfamily)
MNNDANVGAVISAVFVLAVVAFALFSMAWPRLVKQKSTTIYEWQRGLIYRYGVFEREVGAGRYWLFAGRAMQVMVLVKQEITIGAQDVLTSDRLAAKLAAIVTYRIEVPRQVNESFGINQVEVVRNRAQIALRNLAITRTLEELLNVRPQLDAELTAALGPVLTPLGFALEEAHVRDVILGPDARRMYADIERAKLESLAALERARGEQATLRSLNNAARMLKGNPELMNLRILQVMQTPAGKPAPTLVLGGAPGLSPLPAAPAVPGAGDAGAGA